MKFSRLFLRGMGRALLFVLSADLLYLYYVGAWTDPIPVILVSEVVLLWVFAVASLLWITHFFYHMREEAK